MFSGPLWILIGVFGFGAATSAGVGGWTYSAQSNWATVAAQCAVYFAPGPGYSADPKMKPMPYSGVTVDVADVAGTIGLAPTAAQAGAQVSDDDRGLSSWWIIHGLCAPYWLAVRRCWAQWCCR